MTDLQPFQKKDIIVAITGASGAVYARRLLDDLQFHSAHIGRCAVIFSEVGKQVWNHELGHEFIPAPNMQLYANDNFFAPVASGSARYDTMIVIPCSMGTLARLAHGIATDLIARAADVMLKERRRLIVVPREAPLSLVHLENMRQLTLAGAVVCPASPSFYCKTDTVEELVASVTNRVLSLAGFRPDAPEWGE